MFHTGPLRDFWATVKLYHLVYYSPYAFLFFPPNLYISMLGSETTVGPLALAYTACMYNQCNGSLAHSVAQPSIILVCNNSPGMPWLYFYSVPTHNLMFQYTQIKAF